MDAIGIKYNARLQRLVKMVKKDIDETLRPLIRQLEPQYIQDAWPDTLQAAMALLFGRWAWVALDPGARMIASEFVTTAAARSERRGTPATRGNGGRISSSVAINAYSGNQNMEDYLRAATIQNVQLIKSIPAEYLDRVQTMVFANMRAGLRPAAIEAALQEQFGITQRRAKFIARDQTAKVQGDISERKQRGAGFNYFQWLDAHDQRVRHRHREISEKVTPYGKGVYRWDDLPLNDKGQPIKPGQDYQCRCVAVPVPDFKVRRFQEQKF